MTFNPKDVPSRSAETALARFRHQNQILKKFGKPGLTVYRAIDGQKSWEQIAKETGLSMQFLNLFADWAAEKGIVSVASKQEEQNSPTQAESAEASLAGSPELTPEASEALENAGAQLKSADQTQVEQNQEGLSLESEMKLGQDVDMQVEEKVEGEDQLAELSDLQSESQELESGNELDDTSFELTDLSSETLGESSEESALSDLVDEQASSEQEALSKPPNLDEEQESATSLENLEETSGSQQEDKLLDSDELADSADLLGDSVAGTGEDELVPPASAEQGQGTGLLQDIAELGSETAGNKAEAKQPSDLALQEDSELAGDQNQGGELESLAFDELSFGEEGLGPEKSEEVDLTSEESSLDLAEDKAPTQDQESGSKTELEPAEESMSLEAETSDLQTSSPDNAREGGDEDGISAAFEASSDQSSAASTDNQVGLEAQPSETSNLDSPSSEVQSVERDQTSPEGELSIEPLPENLDESSEKTGEEETKAESDQESAQESGITIQPIPPEGESPPLDQSSSEDEWSPELNISEMPSEPSPESDSSESESESKLTPEERIIHERFGDVGVKVYRLIDGQKSAQEILDEVGISEEEFLDILEFMERQGLIKLNYRGPGAQESKAEVGKKEEKDVFSPLLGETPMRQEVIVDAEPIEIPVKKEKSMLTDFVTKTKLLVNFGSEGLKVWNAIDGKKSDVDIMVSTRVPLYKVRDILSFLYDNNLVDLHVMSRKEILKRYGDEAYAIYKKHGATGVGLYEIIDYDLPLKEMARLVTPNKEKFVQIFSFIHRILGVDIPLEQEVLLSHL